MRAMAADDGIPKVRLDRFDNHTFDRGRPRWIEALWVVVGTLLASSLPGSGWRCALLRSFGAKLGDGVVVKPRLRVKFPWRLTVGDDSWLGEGVWIDNLAPVSIGQHCCVSQGAYFCTGSHSSRLPTFDLMTAPIVLDDQSWAAAFSVIGPGCRLGEGAILQLGSVLITDAKPWTRYRGNPAEACGERQVDCGVPDSSAEVSTAPRKDDSASA
ncbi:MAG: WcaF family extracellular polysaccharide biosynthesis acetyltransferase [Pseudomonadota bacterium]